MEETREEYINSLLAEFLFDKADDDTLSEVNEVIEDYKLSINDHSTHQAWFEHASVSGSELHLLDNFDNKHYVLRTD